MWGHDWPQVVDEAITKCREVGAVLLVIDTLSMWAGLRGEDENASGAAAGAMEPVANAAAEGFAVLVARHERKSGGEVGDAGRGSSAFSGAVDVAITLRRLEGDATATEARRLDAVGRYDETPETLVIEAHRARLRLAGDRARARRAERDRRHRAGPPQQAPWDDRGGAGGAAEP